MPQNQCVVLFPSFYNISLLHHLLKFAECFDETNCKGQDLTSERCDTNLNVWHAISIDNGELEPAKHSES